jgi:hypothetical protein
MEEMENVENVQASKRPGTLTLLCVLTFIYASLGILASIFVPLNQEVMTQFLLSSPNYNEAQMADTLKTIQAGWGYHALNLILASASLTGAILMWKLKKLGFHFYAFSNLAILFVPPLLIGLAISWAAIFITFGFIGMYALHLKYMR